MKLNKTVIPGKSMAGICLGNDIDIVLKSLEDCKKEKSEGVILINDGMLTIGYNSDNLIYAIESDKKLGINYGNKLWAGMSIHDVLKCSTKQVAIGGCVIVDGINGIGLPLPPEFDDFDHITDHLPINHIFNSISVFLIG